MQFCLNALCRGAAATQMFQEKLGVGVVDTDSESDSDKALRFAFEEPGSGEVHFFDPSHSIERHVANRRKIKKLGVTLGRSFRRGPRMPQTLLL